MEDEYAIKIAIKLKDVKSNSAKNYCKWISLDPLVIIGDFFGLIFGFDKILIKIFVVVFHSFILAQKYFSGSF